MTVNMHHIIQTQLIIYHTNTNTNIHHTIHHTILCIQEADSESVRYTLPPSLMDRLRTVMINKHHSSSSSHKSKRKKLLHSEGESQHQPPDQGGAGTGTGIDKKESQTKVQKTIDSSIDIYSDIFGNVGKYIIQCIILVYTYHLYSYNYTLIPLCFYRQIRPCRFLERRRSLTSSHHRYTY